MALTQISTGGVKNDAVTAGKIPADAVGQSEIADEAVDEARLQISNAGTNGQFLQKQSGNTGGLTWADANQYTHPNHSGEVTSSADGATTIASNIVDEDNLKISNAGTNGQFLQKQSGNTGGLTWADVTVPPAGNTVDLVADGAIAAGKPVILTTAGKAAQVKETSSPRTSPSDSNLVSGYTQSVDMIGEHAKIAYDDDNNFYVVVYKKTNNNLVCQIGTINANESVGWSSENEIQGNQNFTNLGLCYAGNSRFVLIYRNGNTDKSRIRIGKLTDGNTISWSTDQSVDGVSSSRYNDPRPVKIATDRVAIVCRDSVDGKWTQGRLGVIVGDVTSDTAWTYRSHLELSSHQAHGDYVSSAYNSTDDVTLAVWKKNNDEGYCRAFKVASGTSATITSSSETTFENNNDFQQNKTIWHSGQNKFITTFGRGGNDDIRSKITTVTISGGSISISVGSAIDLSGTNSSLQAHWALELGVTSTGAVWCFWIGMNSGEQYRLNAITDDDFNGSTLAWSSKVNVATGYNDYFYSIDGFCNHEHSNRFMLFGENYSDQPTYFAFQTETISTNVTDKNCIGFANSAISDGNTGTIALNGNLATGQSGLTPATRYWVKNDGTLRSTGKATAEIHLLATASDKGLIQVKTDWTSN